MAEKYSGVWTPDMGEGDERRPPRSSPLPSFHSPQLEELRRLQELREKLRVAAWMDGRIPQWRWVDLVVTDEYGELPTLKLLMIDFPATSHFTIAFEHPVEHGKIQAWCFGCECDDCGACTWSVPIYRAEYEKEQKLAELKRKDAALPF